MSKMPGRIRASIKNSGKVSAPACTLNNPRYGVLVRICACLNPKPYTWQVTETEEISAGDSASFLKVLFEAVLYSKCTRALTLRMPARPRRGALAARPLLRWTRQRWLQVYVFICPCVRMSICLLICPCVLMPTCVLYALKYFCGNRPCPGRATIWLAARRKGAKVPGTNSQKYTLS